MENEIDCECTDDLICPYCGCKFEDSFEFNESSQHQCDRCEKHFMYEVEYSKTFSSVKVDCLNGGEHMWKSSPWAYYPDYRYCRKCTKIDTGQRSVNFQ